MFIFVYAALFITLFAIEGHLRRGSKQKEEIIELLKEIKEKY
ncbi:hypothetical protein [Salirhabdus sp. Marseille-P4669]|nr:hypothetical protein [Salirhabdus sp. Marseille-P4669]